MKSLTINTADGFIEGLRYNIDVGDEVYLQALYRDGEVSTSYLMNVVRTPVLIWISLLFVFIIFDCRSSAWTFGARRFSRHLRGFVLGCLASYSKWI